MPSLMRPEQDNDPWLQLGTSSGGNNREGGDDAVQPTEHHALDVLALGPRVLFLVCDADCMRCLGCLDVAPRSCISNRHHIMRDRLVRHPVDLGLGFPPRTKWS